MIRLQIQLEEVQAQRLKEVAARRHVSAAAVIREALDGALALESRPSFRDVAMAYAGKFSSGLSDVSARHDDYLAEDIDDWH